MRVHPDFLKITRNQDIDKEGQAINTDKIQSIAMSQYIILFNFADQGIKNVKDSPKRAEAFKTAVEKTGGKLINFYYTLGKNDMVAIVEAPNDEAIASVLFATGSLGNVRSETLKAFPLSEAAKIIEKIS